jgi:hypothetical protein
LGSQQIEVKKKSPAEENDGGASSLLSSPLGTRIVCAVKAPALEDGVDCVVNALSWIAASGTLDLSISLIHWSS